MAKSLEKFHYQPQIANDNLSQKIFDNFIEALDPSGLYFIETDLKTLAPWKDKIDDEILQQKTDFIEIATTLYKNRLRLSDSLVSVILANPIEFTGKDTIRYFKDKKKPTRPKNEVEFKRKWTKWLKYEVLEILFTPEEEDVDPFEQDLKLLVLKEESARTKVLKSTKRNIQRLRNPGEGFENAVASKFLNALVECYDPHSAYFSELDKENFEVMISTEVYSFGLSIEENDKGEIHIVQLTPGGAAWSSNQLHIGDVMIKIKVQETIHDLTLLNPEEAFELFANLNTKQAEFTVRKDNGQVKVVPLVKTKVKSEENVVKSFILKGENKIGYISLPSFYTDMRSNNPLGCANDVAKEILKLQNDGIEGLIFDLRYNRGGAVEEAISLSGIFIDEGPLVVYKMRDEKPRILKDINRGTAFNGPLVVMVNGLSASASEIFTAALQDYHRAIIVGSTTYGKATGQVILPLDTTGTMSELAASMGNEKAAKNGFLKVTMEKFFRVTNKTHQKIGVIPDVILPEPFYFADYKEMKYPAALAADSVQKKVVYSPLKELPLKQLSEKSKERISRNKNFLSMKQANDSLQAIRESDRILVLTPKAYKASEKNQYHLIEKLESSMLDSAQAYVAANNQFDQKLHAMDEFSAQMNELLLRNIQNDLLIEESYHIIGDFIRFEKK